MRFLIIALSFVLFETKVYAQQPNLRTDTLINLVGKVNLSISHNEHDLQNFDKSTLARVHARRVTLFLQLLPYMALKAQPAQDVRDMNFPMTKARLKELKKQQKLRAKFFKNIDETMRRVNVHADKKEIIEQIVLIDLLIVRLSDFIMSEEPIVEYDF